MTRVLVVYYSRTGHTRQIAAEIAAALGAEIEEIEDVRSRRGLWGYMRSGREALRRQLIEIRPPRRAIEEFDLVVIGTPVWAGNIASPVRSYLAAQASKLREVAFFCTQGGSGASRVLLDLEDLCGRSPRATLVVTEAELEKQQYREHMREFVRTLEDDRAMTRSRPSSAGLHPPGKQRGCLAL